MPLIDAVPPGWREAALRTASAVRQLDRVIVAAHVNLDGDALGSMSAAGWMLRALGRDFALYSETGLPRTLDFLPLPGPLYTRLGDLPFAPGGALLLDCDEPGRLGASLAPLVGHLPSVNIDHHLGGAGMGTLTSWITPEAAATAELMAYVALALGLELEGALATGVALGLITDTGGFRHGNTDTDVFELCARLARGGCCLADLRDRLDSGWSMGRVRLWSRLLERVRMEAGGRVAFCAVTERDMRECNASREELEGIVDWFRRIETVLAAALLREESPGLCKFSLRSRGMVDVRAAAVALGGGGHRNAAGGTLRLGLEEARRVLLTTLTATLDAMPDAAAEAAQSACAQGGDN